MSKQGQVLERVIALHRRGFIVVPLGNGPEGKAATVRWRDINLPVAAFHRKMVATRSTMYGVRLDGMVVLDVDERDDAIVSELERRFGEAQVIVQTPRGYHLYYKAEGPIISQKGQGLPLDLIKSGPGHYVVGPGSIRPCGGEYVEKRGQLGVTELSAFQQSTLQGGKGLRATAEVGKPEGGRVGKGYRHKFVLSKAIEFVAACETVEELHGNLMAVLEDQCEEPSTVTNEEVQNVAEWASEAYGAGRLYGLSGGFFKVPRRFFSLLTGDPNAVALYMILLDKYGHHAGRSFNLVHKWMEDAALIHMSERGFDRAVKRLLKSGIIVVARNHLAGRNRREYSLAQPPRSSAVVAEGTRGRSFPKG